MSDVSVSEGVKKSAVNLKSCKARCYLLGLQTFDDSADEPVREMGQAMISRQQKTDAHDDLWSLNNINVKSHVSQ